MKKKITTLFLDLGGVLLTNGWDHRMREAASIRFHLDFIELNARHALTFNIYEIGKITLDSYLDRVVFYEQRDFSRESFKEFMFGQSQPYPEMIAWIKEMLAKYHLKVVVVSNEGRELMDHRIFRFKLKEFVDIFICSAYVGLQKPDLAIYQMALDCAQVEPNEVIYFDDRKVLVEVVNQLGMFGIHHTSLEETKLNFDKIMMAL